MFAYEAYYLATYNVCVNKQRSPGQAVVVYMHHTFHISCNLLDLNLLSNVYAKILIISQCAAKFIYFTSAK